MTSQGSRNFLRPTSKSLPASSSPVGSSKKRRWTMVVLSLTSPPFPLSWPSVRLSRSSESQSISHDSHALIHALHRYSGSMNGRHRSAGVWTMLLIMHCRLALTCDWFDWVWITHVLSDLILKLQEHNLYCRCGLKLLLRKYLQNYFK